MSELEHLAHFSATPVSKLDKRSGPTSAPLKPQGLWVSVEGNGDGWSDWCRSEGWGLDTLTYEHRVVLAPGAEVLRIGTREGIDDLTRRYPGPVDYVIDGIDWARVAETYQGVIISPYLWSRRLTPHTLWYYGWDCASGCIWDVDAVESIQLVDRAAVA